jgi:hypothetical protein
VSSNSTAPVRIAFSDDMRRYGAEALSAFAQTMLAKKNRGKERFDWSNPSVVARDTYAMSLLAVSEGKADFALLPFVSSQTGYDLVALDDANNLFELAATRIVSVKETYCLAARADDLAIFKHETGISSLPITEILTTGAGEAACRSALAGFEAQGAAIRLTESAQSAGTALAMHRPNKEQPGVRAGVFPEWAVRDNSRYAVLRSNIDENPEQRWMLVMQRANDETVRLDKYKTTDARTRYFYRRMQRIRKGEKSANGIGVILRFKRDGVAATTADIESYLRS